MRLDYNILWVEDNTDWVETYEDDLKKYLYSLGFELDVTSKTRPPASPEDIERLELDKYHLILMDYELGEGNNGAELIQRIRDLDVVTEVVFYSADQSNLNLAQKIPLQGVYWAARDADFSKRVQKIIYLTIRRVMDLPAMQGLAVAEIADLDRVMNDLITAYHDQQNDEERTNFRKEIIDRLTKSAQDRITSLNNKQKQFLADLALILNDQTGFMDSTKRWRVVNDVANRLCQANEKCLTILKEYENILKQRNDLAHGYSHKDSNGIEKIKGRTKEYSMEDALNIRLGLLKHKENLQELLKKFTRK